jgi:hypothetical protein
VEYPDRAVGVTAAVLIYVFMSLGLHVILVKYDSSAEAEEKREVILMILTNYLSTMGSVGDSKTRGPTFLRAMMG